ncbi:MAG: hypothetical protein ABL985_03325 [Casimicrobium sp.]
MRLNLAEDPITSAKASTVAHSTIHGSTSIGSPTLDDGLFKTIALGILPLPLLSYVVGYMDRINVGLAQLQMKDRLAFSDAFFGLGAGIFFIGYFLLEVPSNLLLARTGARKTLVPRMVSWGIAAGARLLIVTPRAGKDVKRQEHRP